MPTTTPSKTNSLLIAQVAGCALLLFAPACKEQSADADAGKQGTTSSRAKEPDRQRQAQGIVGDDPLLGEWEVTAVVGNHVEANTGLRWEFLSSGAAIARKYIEPGQPTMRGGGEPAGKDGAFKENTWSWKRTGSDRIELRHPASPSVAYIKTTISGDTMVFVWNETGSVFTMKKLN